MKQCSTCKHWTKVYADYGRCALIGESGKSELVLISSPDEVDTLTKDIFGCILHDEN